MMLYSMVSSMLYPQTLESLARGIHSSLLRKLVNYGRILWAQVVTLIIKIFDYREMLIGLNYSLK
jgi:hypothetical protein